MRCTFGFQLTGYWGVYSRHRIITLSLEGIQVAARRVGYASQFIGCTNTIAQPRILKCVMVDYIHLNGTNYIRTYAVDKAGAECRNGVKTGKDKGLSNHRNAERIRRRCEIPQTRTKFMLAGSMKGFKNRNKIKNYGNAPINYSYCSAIIFIIKQPPAHLPPYNPHTILT